MKAVLLRVTAAGVTIKSTGETREARIGMVTPRGVAPGATHADQEFHPSLAWQVIERTFYGNTTLKCGTGSRWRKRLYPPLAP